MKPHRAHAIAIGLACMGLFSVRALPAATRQVAHFDVNVAKPRIARRLQYIKDKLEANFIDLVLFLILFILI